MLNDILKTLCQLFFLSANQILKWYGYFLLKIWHFFIQEVTLNIFVAEKIFIIFSHLYFDIGSRNSMGRKSAIIFFQVLRPLVLLEFLGMENFSTNIQIESLI